MTSNFTNIAMNNGIINFIRPEECEIQQQLRNYSIKTFDSDSMKDVGEEWEEVMNQ